MEKTHAEDSENSDEDYMYNRLEVLSVEYEQRGHDPQPKLCRPCVDCGLITDNFCDGILTECYAKDHIPNEKWCVNQRTPFCSHCEVRRPACRFCLHIVSCTPPDTNVYKGNDRPA
jgi:hypothetical protein